MASTYKLVVTSSGINGTTGHHTINVYVQETRDDGTIIDGVPEVHGIEAVALGLKFGTNPNNVDKWREDVGRIMLDRHIRRSLAHAEISTWHGKKFDIQP